MERKYLTFSLICGERERERESLFNKEGGTMV